MKPSESRMDAGSILRARSILGLEQKPCLGPESGSPPVRPNERGHTRGLCPAGMFYCFVLGQTPS